MGAEDPPRVPKGGETPRLTPPTNKPQITQDRRFPPKTNSFPLFVGLHPLPLPPLSDLDPHGEMEPVWRMGWMQYHRAVRPLPPLQHPQCIPCTGAGPTQHPHSKGGTPQGVWGDLGRLCACIGVEEAAGG